MNKWNKAYIYSKLSKVGFELYSNSDYNVFMNKCDETYRVCLYDDVEHPILETNDIKKVVDFFEQTALEMYGEE